ncbi:hypothetical protein SLA2020_425880 [Shorea laevis]
MDDQKELLREVFGESSDSEDSDQRRQQNGDAVSVPVWEPILGIDGLWLCRDFLSPQQQASLLAAVLNEGWFTVASQNQAMRFGNLPPWATELSDSIRDAVIFGDHISESKDLAVSDSSMEACVLPSILLCREPLFDQLIANAYQPGNLCTR